MSNDSVLRLCRNVSIGLFVSGLTALIILAPTSIDADTLADWTSTIWTTAASMGAVYLLAKRWIKKAESEEKEVEE